MSSTNKIIYLDHNATGPVLPEVQSVLCKRLAEEAGNPASIDHSYGRAAADAVAGAGATLLNMLDTPSRRVVWTSGATESCNLAILGMIGNSRDTRHIVSQETEHPAVLDALKVLGRRGHTVSLAQPRPTGRVEPTAIEKLLRSDTALVSIMLANNETGVLQPIADIAALCRTRGIPLHVDATQTFGRMPVDLGAVDLISGSAHKSGGPPGTGFLILDSRQPALRLEPQIHGGGHQDGLRSGTLNVPAIVGVGAWAAWWSQHIAAEHARLARLRDELAAHLVDIDAQLVTHGAGTERLPNTLNVSFRGLEARALLERLPAIAASSGSACASALPQPSHVLRAMRVPEAEILGAIRLSLGWSTTPDDVHDAVTSIRCAVQRLRRS